MRNEMIRGLLSTQFGIKSDKDYFFCATPRLPVRETRSASERKESMGPMDTAYVDEEQQHNGVILDTLRAYLRSGEFPLSESSKPDVEDGSDRTKIWRLLQSALPNVREQRLAYLLFHSGLTPREIVRFCTHEFNDIHEIYRLRRNILERLLHNMISNQLI
jgi:hypothetical protein